MAANHLIAANQAAESNATSSSDWLKEQYVLAKKVHLWFCEVTRGTRFKVPALGDCAPVATRILIVRDAKKKPKKKHESARYGKIFLKHLKTEREKIETMRQLVESYNLEFETQNYKEMLRKIDVAAHSVNDILSLFVQKPQARDPIRFIAEGAQEAWRSTSDVPTKNSEVLAKFMDFALQELKQSTISLAAIKMRLRGRRGQNP
jgi:hypothetical protein